MEYYSTIKKNAFESVLMRWMKLELIMQNKVSQKEKHQYNTVYQRIYMEFRKDSNNDTIRKIARDTDVKNKLLDYVEGGEGGMI